MELDWYEIKNMEAIKCKVVWSWIGTRSKIWKPLNVK